MPSAEKSDGEPRPIGILVVSRAGQESDECQRVLAKYTLNELSGSSRCVHHLRINGPSFRRDKDLIDSVNTFASRFRGVEFEVHLRRALPIQANLLSEEAEGWCVSNTELRLDPFEDALKRRLANLRLDWRYTISEQLSDFICHSERMSHERVISWLDQFAAFGGARSIGERLLRSLQYKNAQQIVSDLLPTGIELETFDYIAFYSDPTQPKGGDALRFLIGKHLRALGHNKLPTFSDLRNALNRREPCSVLWLEDGLYTATEFRSLIKSLLGRNPPGRAPKIKPLDNVDWIANKEIQFRFANTSNLGYRILHSFLKEMRLSEMCEIHNTEQQSFQSLTDEGCAAFDDGTLWYNHQHFDQVDPTRTPFLDKPRKHIRLHAFRDERLWAANKIHDVGYCRKIGRQLFRQYINSQVKVAGWTNWDEKCLDQCGLGMMGLGFAVAFAHSVPKCSLPLFWASGEVTYKDRNGKRYQGEWMPLFPGIS